MEKIAAAFVQAQRSFAPALKTNTNPHFRSKYVALDGCIEAVIDALNSNGIALLQPTHECADGVTVETIFLHESGEQMSGGKLHVPAAKSDPQGYGSALTYARRYSLMAACGIAPEDDDGNAASRRPATGHCDGKGDIPPPAQNGLTQKAKADFLAALDGTQSREDLETLKATVKSTCEQAGDAAFWKTWVAEAKKHAEKLKEAA